MSPEIFFVPYKEITKITNSKINDYVKAELLALVNRLNTVAIIKKAGSGIFYIHARKKWRRKRK